VWDVSLGDLPLAAMSASIKEKMMAFWFHLIDEIKTELYTIICNAVD
jgi:hypothetical protein